MSKTTNLNAVRKAKERRKNRAKADENAMKFGTSKAQKQLLTTRLEKARRTLEAHKQEKE